MTGATNQSGGRQLREARAFLHASPLTLSRFDLVWAKVKLFLGLRLPFAARLKRKFVGRESGFMRKNRIPSVTSLSALSGLRALVIGAYDREVFDAIRSANGSVTWWETGISKAVPLEAGRDDPAPFPFDLDRPWDVLKRIDLPTFDLVYLHNCLHLSDNPAALLRLVHQLAPNCWIDATCGTAQTACPTIVAHRAADSIGAGADTGKFGFDAVWVERQMRMLNFATCEKRSPFPKSAVANSGGSPATIASAPAPSATVRRFYIAERMDQCQNPVPLLVHVHLPKNGGTSLKNMLHKSFGKAHVEMYTEDPGERKNYIDLLQTTFQYPHALAVSSHSFRTYPHMIGNRVPLYFCFLRDPIERHLSYYRYLRKDWKSLSPQQKAELPPNFMDMSMPEFFAWQADIDRKRGASPNRQVRYFAKNDNLALAKAMLSQFFFVGTTDQLARGAELLNRKLAAYGMSLNLDEIRHDNATSDQYRKTQDLLSDPAVKRYLSAVTSDFDLYNWAKGRFEEECVRYGI